MQQLLQLKTGEPQDADRLFVNPINKNFGRFNELKDLSSILFKSSFLLEVKEETKSFEINLDEEDKKLILKLKKKIKSKSLLKKGQVYALRKELKMASLTLVYDLQPYYAVPNELQSMTLIEPVMNVVKPLDVIQPKTMMLDVPKLPVKPPIIDNTTVSIPIHKHTKNPLQELTKITYEKKFKPFARSNFSEIETELNTDNYQLGPEKIIRYEDLLQQYTHDLIVQTPTQTLEGQPEGIQVIKYDRPRFEDGEYVYQKIRMRATRPTTVYDLLKQSGLPFKAVYSKQFNGKYIPSINGVMENSMRYWEAKINGHYATTSFDKAIVRPGAEVEFVLKTAIGVCGEPIAG